jgi:hypothetical protein
MLPFYAQGCHHAAWHRSYHYCIADSCTALDAVFHSFSTSNSGRNSCTGMGCFAGEAMAINVICVAGVSTFRPGRWNTVPRLSCGRPTTCSRRCWLCDNRLTTIDGGRCRSFVIWRVDFSPRVCWINTWNIWVVSTGASGGPTDSLVPLRFQYAALKVLILSTS